MALTEQQGQQIADVIWAAHDMVIAVARTGNGRDPSVGDFQNAWNSAKGALLAANVKWFLLSVDSAYGPNTGTALGLTFGKAVSTPPLHGSGMTAWYAQNQSVIDALPPRQPSPVANAAITDPSQVAAPPPAPAQTAQQLPPQVDDALQNSSGSTVMAATAVTSSPPADIDMDPTVISAQPPPTAAVVPTSSGMVVDTGPQVLHDAGAATVAVQMDPTPIIGAKRPSRMKAIAIGIAALGLAGGLLYTANTRGRRRARA